MQKAVHRNIRYSQDINNLAQKISGSTSTLTVEADPVCDRLTHQFGFQNYVSTTLHNILYCSAEQSFLGTCTKLRCIKQEFSLDYTMT